MAKIFGTDLDPDTRYSLRLVVHDPDTVMLLEGDLTQFPCDAIVNAANSELIPGGGVDGAIHRAGGPSIREECQTIRQRSGPLAPGSVMATTAGNLPVRKIIHTVGPVWHSGKTGESDILRSCYQSSVRLADDLGFTSMAFPAISTGVYGYPLQKAAEVVIPTLVDEVKNAKHMCLICLVLFDRAAFTAFAMEATKFGATHKIEMSFGYLDA